MSKFKGTPKARGVVAPIDGWEEQTLYVVDVAFSSSNIIHESLFYSGFLDEDGNPSSYNKIFNPGYEEDETIGSVYFIKVTNKLPDGMQVFK